MKFTIHDMVLCAMFTALLAICSWIAIPTDVPFTLQTLGVFLTVGLLGGKRGTITVLVFLLLAAVGVPVLAGFTGGLGILLGSTGGYMLGFLLSALLMWGMEHFWGNSLKVLGLGMVLGMALCYLFGTVWYAVVYAQTDSSVGLWTAFVWCVVPYIIPDIVKIALALHLTARLRPYVK